MPLFSRGKSDSRDAFVDTVPSARVEENEMTPVQVYGRKIILTRCDGVVFAIDSICPHAAADLSKGTLHRQRLCCHEHDYCFDIPSGRILWPEDEVYRLRRYEVKEEAGVVKVRLTPLVADGARR